MNATIQETLLDLFQQVIQDPDCIPAMSIDVWQEGSQERHLLKSFRHMLECMQQSKQQSEQQLREKEEEYRSIFEATTDSMTIATLEGEIVEVNPATCKMYGYTYQEMIGLPPSAILHPDSFPLLSGGRQIIMAGGQHDSTLMVMRKDGTPFPVEAHATRFMYKGKPHLLTVVRDITERVEAEEQLREREAQYRSVFEATSDGLFITDFDDGHLVEVNPAAHKMHGYGYEEFLALHPTAFIHPDSHPLFPEYLQTVKAGGQFHAQAMDVRKDGTIFPVEVYGTSFIYRGKPHVLGVVRDITERVQSEQQLREREEQYRSVFEATDDGLTITDLDGYFIEVNPAYCSMLGYIREELIGLHYSQTTFPEYYPVLDESARAIEAGDQYQTQGMARRKDGSPLPVEAHATPFIYKGKPHVLGVVRDITERVEAEKQLREREEQYRSIFEATNDALFIMDLEDGHIVEANPAACNTYGYSYEEFIGLPPSAVIHPDQLPAFREEGLPSLRAGAKRHLQGVNLRKDGSVFPIDLHQSVFTYQGKPHILAVMRDITEQVQAQQLLEQRVEERTRELSTLLEVSHNVASTIDLKTLLDLILDQLKVVVDYAGSAITILEGEDLVLVGTRGPQSEEHLVQHRFPLKPMEPVWDALCRGELVVIDDILHDTPTARAYRETVGDLLETTLSYVRSWVAVPLKLKDQVIGLLSISYSQPDFYTPHQAELALAIANQAAIAIENARLYAQAQELAALEERQKLARELHDSVSQALYGISLGAHAARTALEREPGEVAEPLDYVLTLADAGLAEMRALIFELRPESLETEGLVSALSKQAAAMQARHELVVSTELCDEPDLPLRAKQELYRIAQEAMHNTVKHAHASRIGLRLEQTTGEITLEVRDNGAGFDTTASFPGHLGLRSMRERVTNLGGTFQLESTPGRGTTIRAHVPGRVGAEA